MIAYSDQKDYVEGDFVHVLVPLGDYTQKKIILGKVKGSEEIVTNIRPFERFAPVTENLNTKYDTAADEFTFVVNKDYEKIKYIGEKFSEPGQETLVPPDKPAPISSSVISSSGLNDTNRLSLFSE